MTAAAIATAAQTKSTNTSTGEASSPPPPRLDDALRVSEGLGGVGPSSASALAELCPLILGAKGERVTLKDGLGAASNDWGEPSGDGELRGDFGAGGGRSEGVLMGNGRGMDCSVLPNSPECQGRVTKFWPALFLLRNVFPQQVSHFSGFGILEGLALV